MPRTGKEPACKNGHEYNEQNSIEEYHPRENKYYRRCIVCLRAKRKRYNLKRAQKKAEMNGSTYRGRDAL